MNAQATDVSEHRWLVLGLLCTAQLLVVLDATIVNIALPSIQRDLRVSDANLQWVINAYVLTFSCAGASFWPGWWCSWRPRWAAGWRPARRR
jgi:MFS family permease